jgi:aquaporin related protein
VCFLGEFVGTFLFIFFAFSGTQIANIAAVAQFPPGINASNAPPNASSLLYVALVFGFSLGVNVWVFYRISGGLFNPAVSF